MRRALLPAAVLGACALPALALADTGAGPVGFLALGFLIGLAHAVEADHVAAVATMIDRGDGRAAMVARGTAWGLGHTLALFLICTTVVIFGLTISGRVEAALEGGVGVMIAALGARVLWRLRKSRLHIHLHAHDGIPHIHAHSHAGEAEDHDAAPHDHPHRRAGVRQYAATLGVGLVHGAAGSAGLLVLTVSAAGSLWQAMTYFAIFGTGAMIGMLLLTAAASVPLGLMQGRAAWMRSTVSGVIGALAVVLGGALAVESLSTLQGSGA